MRSGLGSILALAVDLGVFLPHAVTRAPYGRLRLT